MTTPDTRSDGTTTVPRTCAKLPHAVRVEPGRVYAWCACGRSLTPPFCDGSHDGTGIVPLSYRAERDEWLWFCACKRTHNRPFCDGSHARPIDPGR
jgi:CDGSH iron-sulfur domain-containing protein 3